MTLAQTELEEVHLARFLALGAELPADAAFVRPEGGVPDFVIEAGRRIGIEHTQIRDEEKTASEAATTRIVAPQRGQHNASRAKTRCSKSAQRMRQALLRSPAGPGACVAFGLPGFGVGRVSGRAGVAEGARGTPPASEGMSCSAASGLVGEAQTALSPRGVTGMTRSRGSSRRVPGCRGSGPGERVVRESAGPAFR